MNINFEGKTVLITGAAGFLGRTIAKNYAGSGAENLILTDIFEKENELKQQAEKLSVKGRVLAECIDIRSTDQIKELALKIEKEGMGVDILVNNAGINALVKAVETTEEIWDKINDINIRGAFFMTREIARQSLISRRGNVVFVSSQHGVVGNVLRAAYCASKTGILGLVRALVAEWSVYGVRVNSVAPTFIQNEANEKILSEPGNIRSMKNRIPLKRYANVGDISDSVLFLSSDKASMITGQNLVIDGGYTVV